MFILIKNNKKKSDGNNNLGLKFLKSYNATYREMY